MLKKIVSSRARAEILRLLFGLQAKEVHMRDLERQTHLAIGTIQRELKTLSEIELIGARRDGNRLYYSANRNHPLFEDLHSLVLKTSGLADILSQALSKREIRVAFVFGSFARAEEKGASDIDLVVVGNTGLRKLTPLLKEPAKTLGREINPYVLTEEEFLKRKKAKDHFLTRVLAAPKIFIIGNKN